MLQLKEGSATLIVDSDLKYLAWLKSDPACVLAPPVLAKTGAEAQQLLSDRSRRFAGIFVNPNVAKPGGLSVLRCAHLHQVGTPLFLLCDGESPYPEAELKKLAVHQALRKPLNYAELLALVAPILPVFPGRQADTEREPIEVELDVWEGDFSPIRIENFLSGTTSYFDVYVRIRSGRYVKLLRAGDAFSPDRIAGYVKKGVSEFFIRRTAQETFVTYCEHLATKLVRGKAPVELKISQTLNAGEETLKFLIDRGVSPGAVAHAMRFSDNMRRIVDELATQGHPRIRDFVADASLYDHAVAATLVAGLLLPPLRITHERLRNSIGLAALLHDVGLPKSARYLEDKDEQLMTEEERAIYHKHPQDGAKLLMSVPGLDPLVVQAVYQHHERRDSKGFPMRANCGAIALAAEVVGIADEFVRILRRARTDPSLDPLAHMRARVFDGFSYRVMKAFIDVMWA